MRPPISPILFSIGPADNPIYSLHWYSILIVTGIMLGAQVAAYLAQKDGDDPERIWDLLLFAVIGGVIGARIDFVITPPHWAYFSQPGNFKEVFMPWLGGLRFYGAIIGGATGVLIYSAFAKINPLRLMDYAAPGMALGHAIGRWGNFLNNELYGPPTTLPWGLDIPFEHRLAPYNDIITYPLGQTLFHPAFLYESLLDLGLCLLLMWISRKLAGKLQRGTIVIGYVMGYAIIRFFMDYLRTDGTNAQLISVIAFAACVVALILRYVVFKPKQQTAATA